MTQQGNTDPATLINRARSGDKLARGRLLETYHDYLKLLSRVQLGNQVKAKLDPSDLVQETCLYAHKYFSRFRGDTEAQLIAWLRKILADCVANQVRHYARKKRAVNLERQFENRFNESSRALDRVAAEQTSPSEKAVRREQAVLVATAMEKLPAHYREVIILHHLQGIPFPEVARQMGRTRDSVRKLWVRAVMKLRQLIKDQE